MNKGTFFRSALLGAALLCGAAAAAHADTITFQFQSDHPNQVQLEFYSGWYNREWPGGGQAWDLKDYEVHTFTLRCETGEPISWGAWTKGGGSSYWGIGDGTQDCVDGSQCTFICGEDDPGKHTLDY